MEVGADPASERKEIRLTFMQIQIDIGKVISMKMNETATKIHPQGPSSALELSVKNKATQPVTARHHFILGAHWTHCARCSAGFP